MNDLERVFERNIALLKSMSILSAGDLHDALGDLYDPRQRFKLFSGLPEEDALMLREHYLRECLSGIDRSRACLKVRIDYVRGSILLPQMDHIVTDLTVTYERIPAKISVDLKTSSGEYCCLSCIYWIDLLMQDHRDHVIENIYQIAEHGYTQQEESIVALADDAPVFKIELNFADGKVRRYHGVPDGEAPYLPALIFEMFDHVKKLVPWADIEV